MPTTSTTDYAPLTLRQKQDVKVGNLVRDGKSHYVVVRTDKTHHYPRYTVEVDGKQATTIERYGNGRNLSWRIDNCGTYGGTLADAADRGVRSYLYSLEYAEQENEKVNWIKVSLPYVLKTEAQALDFAFTDINTGNAKVVAEYHGSWYVGFHPHQDHSAEQVERLLNERIDHLRVRVYGDIDPRVVIEALKEQGIQAAYDSTYTQAQVYIEHGSGALLVDKFTGNVEVVTWDSSGGVTSEKTVGQAIDTASAVVAVVRWYKSYDLQQRAQSLLEYLETEVPSGVAHYAVEQAKTALRTLARESFTVDFTYGR